MSVLLQTTFGQIVIDLFTDERPNTCKNFLKLCKIKYYYGSAFHFIQRDFLVQTGDTDRYVKGGTSIFGLMYGDQARFFDDEMQPELRRSERGGVYMANPGKNLNASQFFITTDDHSGDNYLNKEHTLFGEVAEGMEVVMKINNVTCDDNGTPFQTLRIRRTEILDDPFDDPPLLTNLVPSRSPSPKRVKDGRLDDDPSLLIDNRTAEEVEEAVADKEAKTKAEMLTLLGDLPDADVKPPENVLFICKLNPATEESDLEMIFSRFGPIKNVEIIVDKVTGQSLNYGFIEYENEKDCEAAYLKMENVSIDDRRIHVDFSQSVSKEYDMWKKSGAVPRMGKAPVAASAAKVQQRGGIRKSYDLVFDEGNTAVKPSPSPSPSSSSLLGKRSRFSESWDVKSDRGREKGGEEGRERRKHDDRDHHGRDHDRGRDRDNRGGRDRDRGRSGRDERSRGSHHHRDDSRSHHARDRGRSDTRRGDRDRKYDRDYDRDRNGDRDRDHERRGTRSPDHHRRRKSPPPRKPDMFGRDLK